MSSVLRPDRAVSDVAPGGGAKLFGAVVRGKDSNNKDKYQISNDQGTKMKYVKDTGTVRATANGRATVRLDHKSTEECGSCCACSAFGGDRPEIEVPQGGLKEGDKVRVTIPRPNPYLSIFFVFFLPLALLMAGIFIGQSYQGDERLGAMAAIGGGAGLGVALILAWLANRWLNPDEETEVEKI